MEVTCIGLDFQGRGICKTDKIIFVDNLLPTESAIIKITDDQPRFAFAKVIKHLTYSRDRIQKNVISYAPLAHLSYQKQLAHQTLITKETFQKIAGISIKTTPIIYDQPTHYKNKITLHVKKDGFLRLGTYKAKSHTIEMVEEHLLALPIINTAIQKLNLIFTENELLDDTLKHIQIQATDRVLITFITDGKWLEKSYFEHLDYDMVIKTKQRLITFKGNDHIPLSFMGKTFKIYSDTFFQTNYRVAKKLFESIKNEVGGVLVDAYSGAATIGIIMSPYVKCVYSIETNQTSHQSAKLAVLENNIENITLINAKVEDTLHELSFDTLILDPPRGGLHQSLIEVIQTKKPSKIIYISCNLKTLTRDIKHLKHLYQINSVTPVSMFPQTIETETVVMLQLK